MKISVVILLLLLSVLPAGAQELTPGQKEFQAKLRPPKFRPDLGYRRTDNSLGAMIETEDSQKIDLQKIREHLARMKKQREQEQAHPQNKSPEVVIIDDQSPAKGDQKTPVKLKATPIPTRLPQPQYTEKN